MEMCKCDEILMEPRIIQLLLNYNSFLQDSEASIVTWIISLLYYQCFYWTSLITMNISIVAEKEKYAEPLFLLTESQFCKLILFGHMGVQRDAVVLYYSL